MKPTDLNIHEIHFHSYTVMCLKWLLSQGKPAGTPELYGKHHSQHQLCQGTMGVHWHEPWLVGGSRAGRVQWSPSLRFALTHNEHGAGSRRTGLLQFWRTAGHGLATLASSDPLHWQQRWCKTTDNAKQSTSPCQDHQEDKDGQTDQPGVLLWRGRESEAEETQTDKVKDRERSPCLLASGIPSSKVKTFTVGFFLPPPPLYQSVPI